MRLPDALSRRCSLPLLAMLCTVSFFFCVLRGLRADEPFLRADSNGDGVAGMADVQRTLVWLFQDAPPPSCRKAADVDDDGEVGISDALRLFIALTRHGVDGLCGPFPLAGEDPNADDLPCVDASSGAVLEDPLARLEVLDATASGASVTLTIRASSTDALTGYRGMLRVEGDIFANGQDTASGEIELVDALGFDELALTNASVYGEVLRFGSAVSISQPQTIPAANETTLLEITLCLNAGTEAGEYGLTLESGELVDAVSSRAIFPVLATATLTVPESISGAGCTDGEDSSPIDRCGPRADPCDNPENGFIDGPSVSFSRGDANVDGRVSIADALAIRRWLFNCGPRPDCTDAADANDDGWVNLTDQVILLNHLFDSGEAPAAPYLEVGPDPTEDDVSCIAYDPIPAMRSGEVVVIGDVVGSPGQEVSIPVFVTNDETIEAFQLLLEYDPAVFTPSFSSELRPHVFPLDFEGSIYEEETSRPAAFSTGRVMAEVEDQSLLIVGFVPSLVSTTESTPPGVLQHVFSIPGRISPAATPGTLVEITPVDNVGALDLSNEVTVASEARLVTFEPQVHAGVMEIVGDLLILRGDSNNDEDVDVSDGIFTLSWLYDGGRRPFCLDAADATDDGRIDVSDPIATFNALFAGGAALPPPFPERGVDLTPDALPPCGF